MKIKVKRNFFSSLYFKEKKSKSINLNPEDFNLINKSSDISPINQVNTSLKVFLPESLSDEVTLVFVHFNPFLEFVRMLSSYFHKKRFEESSFYFNKNEIVISKISFSQDPQSLTQQMLKAGLTKKIVLDCIICHELGHAVQFNIAKERTLLLPELNEICYFINSLIGTHNKPIDIYQIDNLRLAILENFADLYSMLLMSNILDCSSFELILNLTQEYRHKNIKEQGYISSFALMSFKDVFFADSTNRIKNFNSFIEIENFIVMLICDNFQKIIKEIFPSTAESDSLACGYIAEVLSLNVSHVSEFEVTLIKEFPFLSYLKCLDLNNDKFFQGVKIARNIK